MNSTAVSVQGISKRYRIGASVRPTSSLRESISENLSEVWNQVRRGRLGTQREETTIWALRDVAFDVTKGEVLGLIGRNGAGKSTLLKILARITEPTEGRAIVRGRVASLLEVGTGFHGDLTGRENVLLNGAVLGMRRAEIRRKFDEIVAFSEVEKFIDTPVKHYSSGMYMRLAFAVAAHLEPEVLIVDEVLAVGDAEFQKKCLGKMKQVSGQGRTVLFVSHNLGAVAALCSRCALLSEGRMIALGGAAGVIDGYIAQGVGTDSAERLQKSLGKGRAWFREARIEDEDGHLVDSVSVQDSFRVTMEIECSEQLRAFDVGVRFERQNGQPVFTTCAAPSGKSMDFRPGATRLSVEIPGLFLAPGSYYVTLALHRPNLEIAAVHERLLKLNVMETGSEMWKYNGNDYGCVLVQFPWVRETL